MEKKKVIHAAMLGGMLMMALDASAATLCNNGTASTMTTGTFIKQAFTPKCSANSFVDGSEQVAGTVFAVKGASVKGKTVFGGSSEGGGISACSTFATWAAVTAGANGC